jgi:hypothetical protein
MCIQITYIDFAMNQQAEKHNPKAHTFSGGTRSVWAIAIQAMQCANLAICRVRFASYRFWIQVQKRVQYTLERQAKRDKAPKVDKNPEVQCKWIFD